jgi:hypothetical protein
MLWLFSWGWKNYGAGFQGLEKQLLAALDGAAVLNYFLPQ